MRTETRRSSIPIMRADVTVVATDMDGKEFTLTTTLEFPDPNDHHLTIRETEELLSGAFDRYVLQGRRVEFDMVGQCLASKDGILFRVNAPTEDPA